MGKDTWENWADTISYKLKRLSIASDKTVQEIYKAAKGVVSDAHSVNKELAAKTSRQRRLKLTHNPLFLDFKKE